MLKVFLPSKMLLDIFLENGSKEIEDRSPFCRLLQFTRDIYVTGINLNDYDSFDEDDNSDAHWLNIMEDRLQVSIHNADNFINALKDDFTKVSEEPCAAFYIDGISKRDAELIRDNYGVICQSSDEDIDMNYYMQAMETYDLTKYNRDDLCGEKWKNIFSLPHDVPANAVCIIDRNLFAYDGEPYTEFIEGEKQTKIRKDGLLNLFVILNQALPKSFQGESFDVSIVFEQECIKEVFSYDDLCKRIFNAIDMLDRNYKINASILAFRHGNKSIGIRSAKYYNEITHTRQIISNYYRISAENGLNTTMHDADNKGKSNYSQVLYSMLLFSSGLRRSGSDPAEKTIRRINNDFKKFIEYWKANPDSEEYWITTNAGGHSVLDFKNKLFS